MAKLNARGRTELVRVSNETNETASDLTDWRRRTIALMSDMTVLEKTDVRFKADEFNPSGRKHSYGWKRLGKAKAGMTADKFAAIYEAKGYVRE